MREIRITTSPLSFITIKKLNIDRAVNQHGMVEIEGHIREEDIESYKTMLRGEMWLEIAGVDEEGQKADLFTGIVTNYRFDTYEHNNLLSLTIRTGSYLMDIIPHYRSFQNHQVSYNEVLTLLNENYYQPGIIGDRGIHESIGEFFLQYQETDWAFAKRLASSTGGYLTPAISRPGVIYFFGLQTGRSYTLPESVVYEVRKDLKQYYLKLQNGLETSEKDCIQIIFTDREIYNLFDRITVDGNEMLIASIQSHYVGQELLHTYTLSFEGALHTFREYNPQHNGCSLSGTVSDVKEDRVQIELHGDENADQTILKWFKYSTVYSSPDGTGWYCMPEIGDTVRLHLPEKHENSAYVISSVHLDNPDERNNPDVKSLKTKYGKEVRFTPDSIVITNNAGMAIEISDGFGISIISDKNISISAKEALTVSSDDAHVLIAGESNVTMQQNGASITLDDNILLTGGDLRVQ